MVARGWSGTGVETWLRFLVRPVLGLLVHAFYGYRRSRLRRADTAAGVPPGAGGVR